MLRKHAIDVSQRDTFAHLGVFSDLIDHARSGVLREMGRSCGDNLLQRIRDLLAVENAIPAPRDLRVESTWTKGGLRCEEVSWSVGYGPRTFVWVMKPEGSERLPGVLALHGHDGVKFYSDDDLFSLEGMQAAHLRLKDHYDRAGRPGAYEGRFYPGPHKFDLAMQLDAFNWLKQNL